MDTNRRWFNTVTTNIFFCCALLPFVSPYPINSDVQPLAAAVAFIVYLTRILLFRTIPVKLLYILLVFMLALLFINPFQQVDLQLNKLFALPLGLVTLLFIYDFHSYFSSKVFSIVVKVYFFVSVCFLVFPGETIAAQSLFVRNMNVTEFGFRGISTLSTEPGLFGGLLVGLCAVNLYFFDQNEIAKAQFRLNFLLLFLMIALTKSGSGYVYFLVFVIFWLARSFNYSTKRGVVFFFAIAVIIVPAILLGYGGEVQYGRGMQTLTYVVSNPALLIEDRSVMYRVYSIYVGLLSFFESPFGVGHGAVTLSSQSIIDADPTLNYFYTSYNEAFHPVSSFGFYLTSYGIFFLLLVGSILAKLRTTVLYASLSLLYLFFSYSFAFPIIWMLLVLGGRDGRRNRG